MQYRTPRLQTKHVFDVFMSIFNVFGVFFLSINIVIQIE